MNTFYKLLIVGVILLLFPFQSQAQVADGIMGLQSVLDNIYDTMMPLCSQLTGVGRGIAGFAALWYIASRIWKHLSNAEPIDFYPLFRPFAIGFCILIFPSVIGLINGVMKPTVTGTAAMVENSNKSMELLLKQREEALKKTDKWKMYVGITGSGDRDEWYRTKYQEDPSEEWTIDKLGNSFDFALERYSYQFEHSIKKWMSEVLQVLYQAAALCINTLRTFQLIVLAILGPLVFGLAVFDGFQHTLSVWLGRYINIFLWLPIANIFGAIIGKVQEEMVKLDVRQLEQAGDTFFSATDIGYLVFMIIGIVGYFTVPTVANYLVHAAGGGALQQKITTMFGGGLSTIASGGSSMATGAAMKLGGMVTDQNGNKASSMQSDMASQKSNQDYFKDKLSGNS
ncbi:conjugative transposon protein TraJ [Sphingobacterium sp. UBA5670]|uniref:conjugative transposon protein TraJ n=1 Tax=Sphingobacterium sp. UBA5670 TaxID=1947502 RepID=UPI0025DC646E|nr:conjugative transposon protein TraJ [Sphingobacterium sp. UBA5670]